jgi:hypothetical protein
LKYLIRQREGDWTWTKSYNSDKEVNRKVLFTHLCGTRRDGFADEKVCRQTLEAAIDVEVQVWYQDRGKGKEEFTWVSEVFSAKDGWKSS